MSGKTFRILPKLAALFCALLMTFSFAACGGGDGSDGNNEHAHSFASTLTQGETEHYYECACGARQGSEPHSYTDGVCKCGKKDPNAHSHEFSTTLTQGDTEHYYECACGARQGNEPHSYTDGVCKCGKKDPNAHSHEFSTTLTQGDTEHYYECACGARQGSEPHSYTDGVCKCGKKDPNAHSHKFSTTLTQGDTEHYYECACGARQGNEPHSYTDGVCKCGKKDPASYSFPESVNFGNDVGVHDPSIFKDPKDGTYYAFGSHFAVASSTDLIHWTQRVGDGSDETSGQREAQNLYGNGVNWRTVLTQAVAHAGSTSPSTWAPDVEYYNGKYYMYVSLSSFGTQKSAIVRVEADSVLGVYGNERMIVKSSAGDAPNCIDPELFYDKEGGLWMVYGSFFGGIYIKELYNSGANWGLPKEDGFGTLLWKGGGTGPEGPYIFRNGDYYYLMVSDGSLSTNYNMRVARSTSPAGPYYDITGADMAAAYGKGNKLAGNWQFGGETGKAAYGHNSVCEIDGEYFTVAHMRYQDENGGVTGWHNLRVHRLLFNEQGWPVLASERYAGETLGKIAKSEIAGKYDLILHSEGMPSSFVSAERYTFTADGKITGAANGVWNFQADGNYIEITLNGVTYKGVAVPVWTSDGGKISLSAVSDAGRSLWANAVPPAPDPGLDIVRRVTGEANGISVAAFDADEGFTVSFRAAVTGTEVGADWDAHALVCRGLEISLPNLRATAGNEAGVAEGSMFPGNLGENVGTGTWNSYLGGSSFVTVTVSAEGVKFYRNGACTQSYPAVRDGAVEAFVTAFLVGVKADGFVFAESGFSASDLLVSRGAADAVSAKAIYEYYG